QVFTKRFDTLLRLLIRFHVGEKRTNQLDAIVMLRPHHERPCCRCPPAQGEKFAPLHSITSSARASSVGGISRPSAFAVVRFTTSSNLVGCSTGMSPGSAPRKIRSTKSAARRNRSLKFAP